MKIRLLALLCALSAAQFTHAQITSRDWKLAGDNNLTFDASTGLEWLDLTLTYNKTVTATLPDLNVGGLFEGFRLATVTEVQTLINNAGVPTETFTGTIPATGSELANADILTGLLGETVGAQFGSSYFGSRGHLNDNGEDRVVGYYRIGSTTLFNDYFEDSPSWPGAGVWLVRSELPNSAVPEPSTYGLMGAAALVGLVLVRRKRRQK
jgi:hypothetical protein